MVSDLDFEGARIVAGALTPVPGWVSPMTIVCLLRAVPDRIESFGIPKSGRFSFKLPAGEGGRQAWRHLFRLIFAGTEQQRPDVLKKQDEWIDRQIGLDPDKSSVKKPD
ncbi:hypothetical protein [Bradyrhizobium sp. WSM1743]|uniref:hypothetical protein n=1 Tax=Bradyrhizobium sp. WSM1743 TaxID=318996 RepID=UPI0004817903